MKVRLVLILGLALQAGAAFAAPVADPASATLALIPAGGERAPADAVMNRLEAAWLAQPGAALVERAQLDKILAEHQITGAALVDPAQRVRLGQLVPADLLVFLDSIPKLPKPATRLQVTESKTGIVLASGIFEDEVLLRDQAPALDLVRTAMGKQAVPAADRHLLGYLEFRSEESGPMLDGIAAALGTLVITDLARAPHIIVLEREHLQHLQTERDLTKLEQDLRASVRLLEGGVRRAPETNKLTITVLLRPLAGGESLTTALTVSRDDVSAARNLIGAAVARLLQARQPEQVTVDRATEAAVFARQAELWLAWNDRPRATQAAETAFALDSNQANRLLLAEILIHGEPQPGRVHVDSQTLALMRRRPSLSNAIRANELLLDYYRRQLELIASSVETNLTLPSFEWQARAPAAGDSPGIRRQQNELARLEDTAFRVQLDHYRQHYAQTRAAYWETWQHRLGQLARYRPDEPAKQIALVREAVQAFAQPPEPVDPIPYQRLDVLTGLPGQMTEIMTGPS
ncbi:hypothetical protein HQ590_03545, partial [bacterium]|nr:hypothetical protein [bacterium]